MGENVFDLTLGCDWGCVLGFKPISLGLTREHFPVWMKAIWTFTVKGAKESVSWWQGVPGGCHTHNEEGTAL